MIPGYLCKCINSAVKAWPSVLRYDAQEWETRQCHLPSASCLPGSIWLMTRSSLCRSSTSTSGFWLVVLVCLRRRRTLPVGALNSLLLPLRFLPFRCLLLVVCMFAELPTGKGVGRLSDRIRSFLPGGLDQFSLFLLEFCDVFNASAMPMSV